MKIACHVLAKWDAEPDALLKASRVYVLAENGKVHIWLPGQGRISLDPSDAQVIGGALLQAVDNSD